MYARRRALKQFVGFRSQNQITYDVHTHGSSQSQARRHAAVACVLGRQMSQLKNGLFRNIYLAKKNHEKNLRELYT